MQKQFLYWLICSSTIVLCSSCSTYDCGEAVGLTISTVAINAADRQAIILRKFIKGSGFTKMEDSILVTAHYEEINDTATAGAFYGYELLNSKYDYEIYLPAINKRVRITNIYEPQQKMKTWFLSTNKVGCGNIIQSYNQDGRIVNNDYALQNRVYVHK